MVIASSIHQVSSWGAQDPIFLEGVTRSNKIMWTSVKINLGSNNRGKAPPAITGEICTPFKQLIQAS